MPLYEVILLALGLSTDCFAVTFSIGASGHGKVLRSALRMAFHFGLFAFLMVLLGCLTGSSLIKITKDYTNWAAFVLLTVVGCHMLYEALSRPAEQLPADPTRGIRMVTLSLATNLDALAVGLSLGLTEPHIWQPILVIGLVTVLVSLAGIYLGARLHNNLGRRLEIAGGLAIIIIGLHALF